MADNEHKTDSTVPNADRPGDVDELERMIAADEAELSEKRGRNDKGQFTGSQQRGNDLPKGRQTPEVLSARQPGAAAGDAGGAAAGSGTGTGETKKTDEGKAGQPVSGSGTEPADASLSPFAKAKKREAEAWKKINDSKAELELREKAIEAREKAGRASAADAAARAGAQANGNGNGNGNGSRYSRAEYLDAAGTWEAQARQWEAQARALEDNGDFDKADGLLAKAKQNRGLAASAREAAEESRGAATNGNGNGNGNGHTHGGADETSRQWATLKSDLPEALVAGSPLNKALIEYVGKNGAILNGPDGVYRAAIQVGREMVSKLERESARVPQLTADLEAANKKIAGLEAELQRATSLPGGEALNRGEGPGGKPFGELSTGEMQSRLEAE